MCCVPSAWETCWKSSPISFFTEKSKGIMWCPTTQSGLYTQMRHLRTHLPSVMSNCCDSEKSSRKGRDRRGPTMWIPPVTVMELRGHHPGVQASTTRSDQSARASRSHQIISCVNTSPLAPGCGGSSPSWLWRCSVQSNVCSENLLKS